MAKRLIRVFILVVAAFVIVFVAMTVYRVIDPAAFPFADIPD